METKDAMCSTCKNYKPVRKLLKSKGDSYDKYICFPCYVETGNQHVPYFNYHKFELPKHLK